MSDPKKDALSDEDPADDAAASEERGLSPVEAAAAPSVEERLEALEAEVVDLRDQLLRKRADFENYRRRVERDRHNTWNEASADVFRALVPTLDNLERALQSSPVEDPMREGVALILRELMGLLEARGVTVEDPLGQPFDPERHQALSHEVVPGAANGTVVETFSKGYLFKDRLLRPALVKVAKEAVAENGEEPQLLH